MLSKNYESDWAHWVTIPQTRLTSAVRLIVSSVGLHLHVLQDEALVAVMAIWWKKIGFVCQNWRPLETVKG